MSLGYAAQSILLLETLYSDLKNLERESLSNNNWNNAKTKIEKKEKYFSFPQILGLYTFALYNKGEAEILLREEDSALRAFRRITQIFETGKTDDFAASLSDYNSALLRKGLIFIEQGRGKEAINCLDEAKNAIFNKKDYRIQVCDL